MSPRILSFLFVALGCWMPLAAFAQTSLFADPKAHSEGDVLTIVLAERTAAQRESAWQNDSRAGLGTSANVAGGTLSGSFAADATFRKDAEARNESAQSDLLQGTMTALVVGVEPTGNLQVRGERKISVNGEAHLLSVSGVVRPFDIRYDNTVLSYQIANAEIEYRRSGFARRMFKPGAFVKFGAIAALGAALLFAAD
jgi:flagellar L-ring protein precursor FlgH